MKKTALYWGVVCAALGGCALIELPFKLIGGLLNGVFSLLGALLNVGSSAAMQAAKWTPLALLFTQAPAAHESNGFPQQAIEYLADALEKADPAMLPYETALAQASADSSLRQAQPLLIDPQSLLTAEGRKEIERSLGEKRIVSVSWVSAEPRTQGSK